MMASTHAPLWRQSKVSSAATLQAPTAPILRKPSTVRLRKGFPMSMTTSILGDLKDPEKPLRGILDLLSWQWQVSCVCVTVPENEGGIGSPGLSHLGEDKEVEIGRWPWLQGHEIGCNPHELRPIHPLFATAARGHRSSSPLVWRVRLSLALECCAVLLLDHQARAQGYDTNEGSCRMWSVQAWTAQKEPGYVQALCWQVTHQCQLASCSSGQGRLGLLSHCHIFVQLFFLLKVRNVSYANQVLGVKRVNQRAVEGTKRDGMVVLKADSPCKVSFKKIHD